MMKHYATIKNYVIKSSYNDKGKTIWYNLGKVSPKFSFIKTHTQIPGYTHTECKPVRNYLRILTM